MELAYTEIWNSNKHGYNADLTGVDPHGHILLLENVYHINDHITECIYDPVVSHFLQNNDIKISGSLIDGQFSKLKIYLRK